MDMQLYVLSPILIAAMLKSPRLSAILISFSVLFCMVASFVVTWKWEFQVLSKEYIAHYYYLTHLKAAPWLIGFIMGYVFSTGLDGKGKVLSKRTIVLCWSAWFFAIVVQMVAMIYVWGTPGIYFENTLRKLAWVYALSWIAFCCHFGYGGPLNTFLSLPIFQILSKLTYSSYLVHGLLILTLKGNMHSPVHATHFEMIVQTCGFWVLTQFAALLFNLTIESPMILLTTLVKRKQE
ncbi:O-acyltransferase like protein-like [Photinus pyralis]|uniref:O-acyltransferase like protein-like n=1 Tax=Photinus pyralis TaxID=7054 RepID=UPI0012672864|nr:O-acyltransferase like protein-like [Photinus pyralis]